MMNQFRLALIQMDCKFGDVEENLRRAEKKVREAHQRGGQIICLPEGFNTGYYCKGYEQMRRLAEPLDGQSILKMRQLAKELGVYLVAPIMLSVATGIAENTAVFIDDEGNIVGTYSKTHLVGEEQLYLRRGREYPVFRTKYGIIGLLVCYDLCFPETSRILALKGADVILCVAAWRGASYYSRWLNQVAEVRALDNNVYIGLVNSVGGAPDALFCGNSQIIDPVGGVLGRCSEDQEEILYQDILLDQVYEERMGNTVLIDRHPADYEPLLY